MWVLELPQQVILSQVLVVTVFALPTRTILRWVLRFQDITVDCIRSWHAFIFFLTRQPTQPVHPPSSSPLNLQITIANVCSLQTTTNPQCKKAHSQIHHFLPHWHSRKIRPLVHVGCKKTMYLANVYHRYLGVYYKLHARIAPSVERKAIWFSIH